MRQERRGMARREACPRHEARTRPSAGSSSQIRLRDGVVSIGRLRERTGWSKTRLASTFHEQVGVSPKQYARVMRFSRVIKLIHAETASFADIAHEAGYYDQPHMNAEFKELSGLTPTEFQNAHRYADSVSVAET